MCDVIKIRLKRRTATRRGKENQPLNIKRAVERPILMVRLTIIMWSFILFYFFLHPPFLIRIFVTSHMPLYSASKKILPFSSAMNFEVFEVYTGFLSIKGSCCPWVVVSSLKYNRYSHEYVLCRVGLDIQPFSISGYKNNRHKKSVRYSVSS